MKNQQPKTINVTHNYPTLPGPSEAALELVRSLAKAARANATAIEQNAMAIQKIALMSSAMGAQLHVEASAFTAKNGAMMDISAPTTVSTSSTKTP